MLPLISFVFLLAGCASVNSNASSASSPQSTIPVSKEATFIESTSPSEVMIRATGQGIHKKKSKHTGLVVEDARRTALWYVLHAPVDPLLQTPDEVKKFSLIEDGFYNYDNLKKYLTWESGIEGVALSIKKDGKTVGKQVTMSFKINKKLLEDDLAAIGIVVSAAELSEELGMPSIMVLPEAGQGENPLSLLGKPKIQIGAAAIESYLTALKYDVLMPQAAAGLQDQVSGQQMIAGLEDDPSYSLALSMGSDIYITYSVHSEKTQYRTLKAAVGIKAYETTTARLLGTETGYSQARPTAEAVVVEEAVHDAIDRVLSRIQSYWKDDLERGVQYKIVAKISGVFDEDRIEDIQFAFSDILEDSCNKRKENIVSESTMDYQVWVDQDQFSEASKLYRHIKKLLPSEVTGIKVSKLALNRKLLILDIKEAE